MNLKHLTDKILLIDTKKLVSTERELTVKILHHLREIDRRKLYSDAGYSSLYDYCVRELGYSEAAAHRRISSARLLCEIPAIEGRIESGVLSLTNLSSLGQFFKENQISGHQQKEEIIKKVEGLSKRECDLKLMQLSDVKHEKKHCLWITETLMTRLKDYRSLKGTNESFEELISDAIGIGIKLTKASKFKLVNSPRKPQVSASRIPTASVKREVFLRDKQCVKCGSQHNLQYDHKHPYALGGSSTPDNIRILCHNCNQRERIRQRL